MRSIATGGDVEIRLPGGHNLNHDPLTPPTPSVAIACGGTGGHLFPGLAVADQLVRRGCATTLLISPKEVDQQAVKGVSGMEIVTLPAVGLKRGGEIAFVRGFIRSYRAAARLFKARPPQAVLAMGGFTSAPPILAARRAGAQDLPSRIQHHPRPRQPLAVAGRARGLRRFPKTAARLHSRA